MNRTEFVSVLALALSLLITYSLIAHAASNQPLAILADFCHSVVASIWIGGVFFLAFAAVPKLAASIRRDDKGYYLIYRDTQVLNYYCSCFGCNFDNRSIAVVDSRKRSWNNNSFFVWKSASSQYLSA